jgi:hypothetical protein
VFKDDVEIESGLEFSDEAVLDAARKCVTRFARR